MFVLLSTPRRVLALDLESGQLHSVHEAAIGYYGLSWSGDSLFVAHSEESGVGHVTRLGSGVPAPCFGDGLESPHQIECVDEALVVANTANECLSVFDHEGRLQRTVHPDPGSRRDRPEKGPRGHHFNSVHHHEGRLYVVAHNNDRRSQVWVLEWPSLATADVIDTSAIWAHNTLPCEHGLLVCDSKDASLAEARSGQTVWRAHDDSLITRGLAATPDRFIVGLSERANRARRGQTRGAVAVLDRTTLRTIEVLEFEGGGEVRDLRVLDAPDSAHRGADLAPSWLLRRLSEGGSPAQPVMVAHRRRRAGPRAPRVPLPRHGHGGLRVCVWSPLVNLGGGTKLTSALVRALARAPGIDSVRLAAPRSQLSEALAGEPGVRWHGLDVPRLTDRWAMPLEEESRFLGLPGTGRLQAMWRRRWTDWDRRALAQASGDCDVVWCPWPHMQPFPEPGVPMVITIQDLIFFDHVAMAPAQTANEWKRLRAWLEGSAAIVVSSDASRLSLGRHFGGQYETTVIRHAVAPEPPPGTATRRTPTGRPYFLCLANTAPHKNHANLLLAWGRSRLRRTHCLVLVGAGTADINAAGAPWRTLTLRGAQLASLARRLDLRLGDDVLALGYVSDEEAHALLRDARALVMPSLSEGGGSFPAEEAASLGVPIACSDIPVMREHLGARTAKVAWFDPDCVGSMANALDSLAENYDEYKRAAVAGRADVRPGWDEVAGRYAALFRQCLENPS